MLCLFLLWYFFYQGMYVIYFSISTRLWWSNVSVSNAFTSSFYIKVAWPSSQWPCVWKKRGIAWCSLSMLDSSWTHLDINKISDNFCKRFEIYFLNWKLLYFCLIFHTRFFKSTTEEVNFGSGNGLVPLGMNQCWKTIDGKKHHYATMS